MYTQDAQTMCIQAYNRWVRKSPVVARARSARKVTDQAVRMIEDIVRKNPLFPSANISEHLALTTWNICLHIFICISEITYDMFFLHHSNCTFDCINHTTFPRPGITKMGFYLWKSS
jgi:hypothetical protein